MRADTELLVLGVGYLAGVPLWAFLSYFRNIPGTCWNCRGVWFLAPETVICHMLSLSMGRLGCSPARCEPCRVPGSAAQPAEASWVWSRCSFSLPSGKICTIPPPSTTSSQNPTFCHLHFFITSMLMNSWQISDPCFHSFTFADGNILAYLKKKKLEVDTFWKFGTKTLCISFNISCIICRWKTRDQFKPGAQLGYSETFRMHSFCVLHLVRALLHFVITWSSQFSSQMGFWDKTLEQVREYYFKLELELDSQGSGGSAIPGGV